MEHTNETKETTTNTCGCPNNYNKEVFLESFAVNDSELDKCMSCPNYCYKNGTASCSKFGG